MLREKIAVVIPAYNEERTIIGAINEARKVTDKVFVIDDASTDRTGEMAKNQGVRVYRHLINLGLGGALKTGFLATLQDPLVEFIITMDADGQHERIDFQSLLKPLEQQKAEVVIGSRLLARKGKFLYRPESMPLSRFIFNRLANLITFLFYGLMVSDSQSGLRVFSRRALKKINLKGLRMEISSEIIGEIKKQGLILEETPIGTIYTNYSLSKGQSLREGLKTFLRILIDKFS